jgi:hypothetical protein
MPNLDTHTQVTVPIVGGMVNIILGMLFDIEPHLLFVVFIGACIGLVYRPALPEVETNFQAIKQFFKECGWLVIVTILASWTVPWVLKFMPEMAQKTIAGGTGIVVMLYRDRINSYLSFAISIFTRRADK